MLKLEMQPRLFSLENLYNMQKTLFSGVYLICNIKVNICLLCTMIADKKCHSRKLKLWKSLMRTFFALAFQIFCSPFFVFVFLSSYFLPFGIYGLYQVESMRNLF